MPRCLADLAAAAMGGKIYVTGGESDSVNSVYTETVNSVYVYDPQADAWTPLASMSSARQHHASAAVGGKLYVFGGMDNSDKCLSTVEVYDPASNSWEKGPSLTSSRSHLVAVAL